MHAYTNDDVELVARKVVSKKMEEGKEVEASPADPVCSTPASLFIYFLKPILLLLFLE